MRGRRGPWVGSALVASLAIVVAAFGASAAPSGPAPGGTLTLGIRQEPSTLDPHASANGVSQRALAHLYDGLVFMTSDGTYHPWLATRWDVSPDGKTYTLSLRHGVKFHDGAPFTSDAVKLSLDRIVDPATHSTSAISAIGPYASTEVVDPYTVRVHLKEPYSPFINALSQPWLGMVSPAAVKSWGPNYGQHPAGTGPFKFVEMIPQDHITLARNPDYAWPPTTGMSHSGPAHLDRVIIRTIPEDSTRLATLQNGETNLIEPVPEQDIAQVQAQSNLYVLKRLYMGAGRVMFLNTQRPPTNDLRVRRAILYAVDTATLVKTLFFGAHLPGRSPVSPRMPGYDKSLETMYTYDPPKARQLLDEAGWRPGQGGVRTKDGQPLQVSLFIIANIGSEPTAEYLQSQLRQVGIDVQIRSLARAAWYEGLNRGDHNLMVAFFVWPDPDMLRTLYFSTNIPFNWSHYNNPEVDRQLLEAHRVLDMQKRITLYRQIERKVMEDALVLTLFYENNVLGAQRSLQGVKFDPVGYPLFYDAYIGR
jgi:peptide/nickel transport system substrate-binding protein